MKYSRYLLIGLLALLLGGCGTTVKESLKVQPAAKSDKGADKTIVILPFADYSYADNLDTAYHRNLYITENLTDNLVSNSFHLPVQEDVFLYLVNHNIINVVAYEKKKTGMLEDELNDEWSDAMKGQIQRYIDLTKSRNNNVPVLESPGTHGLTQQEVVKIGRHFSADYIVRGRIIQYKEREDPSWAPWKKGVIGFITGVTNKIAFGQARSDQYDNWGNMAAGATYGALIGDNVHWPYTGDADQTIFGVSGGQMGNTLIWGAVGAGLGHMAHNTGKIPQAVVQLRVWVQDAYNGDVVWTNRVDVKVSPESVLADYQYDALFEGATEKAVSTLIDNFTATL
ncbi:hypothetical protein [Desulfogranum marinum]|uniref:hypothetical protein n=1 Tax=Desulfogranum marinum TaxID=453220 RepID=UPI00196434CB|nr:hypothetical protein [Desulfogranum marinum]MBM9513586.1 hypothetical protein [Desulfogranum marinum]